MKRKYRGLVLKMIISVGILSIFTMNVSAMNEFMAPLTYKNTYVERDYRDCIFDSVVVDACQDLWRSCGFGHSSFERGAFIVDGANGIEITGWGAVYNKTNFQAFLGRIPAGTFAIVHTHPRTVSGKPSMGDMMTADRLGLLMLVLSREGVWCYDPAQRTTSQLAGRDYLETVLIG